MGGGFKGAGSSGSISVQPSPYETALGSIAQHYWDETDPLRHNLLTDYQYFTRPGSTAYSSSYAPTSYGGTTGTTSPTVTSAAAIPSVGDLNQALTSYYGGYGVQPYQQSSLDQLSQYGITRDQLGPSSLLNIADRPPSYYTTETDPETGLTYPGSVNPAFTQYVDTKANQLRTDMLAKQMAAAGSGTGTTGTTGTSGASGYSSSGFNRYDPYALPGYQPIYNMARGGLEDQYNVARQNILAGTQRGGALSSALSDLERSRAYGVGALPAQISTGLIQDIMDKAYGVAFASPQTTMSGLSSAAQLGTSRSSADLSAQLAQQQMSNQMSAGLGSGLGILGGSLLFK